MTYMTWEVYVCNQDNTSILLLLFALSGEVLFEEGRCLCDYKTRGKWYRHCQVETVFDLENFIWHGGISRSHCQSS